jgi:tetratricopeptide (TPR) repeat protein
MGRFSQLETGGLDEGSESGSSKPRLTPREKRALAGVDEHAPQYDSQYYLSQAEKLLYAGHFDKALRKYSRAAEQSGANVDCWIGQILCLSLLGRSTEAQNWARRALELFPEDTRLISLQGLAYAQSGTVQRGLACSDFALSKGSADPLCFLVRGMILELAENTNSKPVLDKAIELRPPHDFRVPLLLGMFLMNSRRQSKALEYLEMATREAPSNDLCWERLGEAYGRLGMGSRAAEAFRQALQINPANQPASHGLAAVTNSSVVTRLMRRIFGR